MLFFHLSLSSLDLFQNKFLDLLLKFSVALLKPISQALAHIAPKRRPEALFKKRKEEKGKKDLLINNPLNPIQPHLQRLHLRPITKPHKMMTRTIKQISSL